MPREREFFIEAIAEERGKTPGHCCWRSSKLKKFQGTCSVFKWGLRAAQPSRGKTRTHTRR